METNPEIPTVPVSGTPAGRPQFLSVLCILTWIGSGLVLIMTLSGVFFKPSQEKQFEEIEKMRQYKPEMADCMEEMLENRSPSIELITNLLSVASSALSILAALMMWQLKRNGFYLYLFSEALPYLIYAFDHGNTLKMMDCSFFQGAGMAIVMVTVVFDALFVVLYASNLKHMRAGTPQ
jgi:hypothetical protein